ncbi:hypothetical protein QYM36_001482, partial [Artemia franciscana]
MVGQVYDEAAAMSDQNLQAPKNYDLKEKKGAMVRIVHFVVVYLCFSKGLARQEWSGGEVLAEVEWIGRSITGVVPDPENKNLQVPKNYDLKEKKEIMRRIVDFVVILLCFSKGLTDTPTRVLYNVTEWIGRSIVGVVPDPERTIQCYGPYGCYSIDPPWTSAIRPIGVFPKPPNQIAPSFCFRSKKNPNLCLNISKPQQISYTDYNGQKPTVIITHGYMENGRQAWLQDMATTLMLYYDANVIVLDWVSGSAPPYTQAVANIRLIGTMVAQFIVEVS